MTEAGKSGCAQEAAKQQELKFPQYNRVKHFPNTEVRLLCGEFQGLLKDIKGTHQCPML